ncbi:hypothetical protein F383_11096 [Gossypium arboreum]|uniref:Uncharacterized protein n=1 Tax=Gossypium arboreum TaxID=29729 RepID=A0A0B0PUW8_GOSAR|nr:hypothetical protein F383_11096 [Gossypium arboreum]
MQISVYHLSLFIFICKLSNPRESHSITDVCALMEPTPDSGVSCSSIVA